MKKTICILLCCIFLLPLCSACGRQESTPTDHLSDRSDELNIPFYRKVARRQLDNGWVFTFVRDGMKNGDDSDIFKYSFKGINIKYQCSEKIGLVSSKEDIIAGCLIFGNGTDTQRNDMATVSRILTNTRTDEELLALNPSDYTFEELDGELFFALMHEALTGAPQREGTDLSYWEKPEYFFFVEKSYLNDYKFQISALNETGLIDVLHVDVMYKTGEGRADYQLLSDLVVQGKASEEQQQAYELLQKAAEEILAQNSYIAPLEICRGRTVGGVTFDRLCTILEDIHNNKFEKFAG